MVRKGEPRVIDVYLVMSNGDVPRRPWETLGGDVHFYYHGHRFSKKNKYLMKFLLPILVVSKIKEQVPRFAVVIQKTDKQGQRALVSMEGQYVVCDTQESVQGLGRRPLF
jgi:hypothetical protein